MLVALNNQQKQLEPHNIVIGSGNFDVGSMVQFSELPQTVAVKFSPMVVHVAPLGFGYTFAFDRSFLEFLICSRHMFELYKSLSKPNENLSTPECYCLSTEDLTTQLLIFYWLCF